jgi:hypothetical protein
MLLEYVKKFYKIKADFKKGEDSDTPFGGCEQGKWSGKYINLYRIPYTGVKKAPGSRIRNTEIKCLT